MNIHLQKKHVYYGLIILTVLVVLINIIISLFGPKTSPIKPKGVMPAQDITGKTIKNPSQQITFTLSKDVNVRDITINVSPLIDLTVQPGSSPGTIVIFPAPPDYWHPNTTYTITILDGQEREITTYQIMVPHVEIDEVKDENPNTLKNLKNPGP